MAATILCIDDEMSVLKTLQRVLMPSVENILLAQTSREALDLVQQYPVDVVLCDMRMPEMDGYETLQAIRKISPRTSRVILSGYTTKEVMLKAVLDGTASVYVQKPCKTEDLQSLLLHLLAIRKELDQDGLQDLFNRINGLPALPRLYQQVLVMIANDRSIPDITEMIEREPAYTTRILHVANSAIHGVSIGSLRQAILYLGLSTVKNIILTCEIFSNLQGQKNGPYGVEALWIHSNLCNLAVSTLYRMRYDKPVGDDIASLGLLHDIGKFLLIKYFPDACREIERRLENDPTLCVWDEEQRVLGASHAELGGLLLDWWNIPAAIIEGCLFHHNPLDPRVHNRAWISLLRIADHLAWRAQGETSIVPSGEELNMAGFDTDILENQELAQTLDAARLNLAI